MDPMLLSELNDLAGRLKAAADNDEDVEAPRVYAAGLVIRDLPLLRLQSGTRDTGIFQHLPGALQEQAFLVLLMTLE